MPCTAKKFEASRAELKARGLPLIDQVITTREFAWLIKKNKIDFLRLKPEAVDNPSGSASGAAAIYGASGGVMESALRTAQSLARKNKNANSLCDARLDFTAVRGSEGIKQATVAIGKKQLKVAVVNGIGNIDEILKNLSAYDYVEVMACPDGCVGGGGQPIPTTTAIRKKRLSALYKIDANSKIRKAHENQAAMAALEWLKGKGKLKDEVLYTKYKRRG